MNSLANPHTYDTHTTPRPGPMSEIATHNPLAPTNKAAEPIDLISLGAGVQSSTLALMADEGLILSRPYAGIFADTQQEPLSVYRWLSFLCGVQLQFRTDGRAFVEPGRYNSGKLSFPVHIVTTGDIKEDALRVRQRKDGRGSWVPSGVPHYSINADGSHGHGPRQCTHDFKIIPIEREQRAIIGASALLHWRKTHKSALREISRHRKALADWKRSKKLGHEAGTMPIMPEAAWNECQSDPLVIAWIGISTDEASRTKPSRVPYVRYRWPHIERGFNREDCEAWLEKRGLKAPKSACKFCPYHNDDEWIRLRDEEPLDFADAVSFDYAYRDAKAKTVSQNFTTFLHPSRVPLDQVSFVKSQGKQLALSMFNNECEGMCGV